MMEAKMAHVFHQHRGYVEDSWPHALYRAAIVCLALAAVAAFCVAVSTTSVSESDVSTMPPMFPLIPLL
jgi:hypothetical protein